MKPIAIESTSPLPWVKPSCLSDCSSGLAYMLASRLVLSMWQWRRAQRTFERVEKQAIVIRTVTQLGARRCTRRVAQVQGTNCHRHWLCRLQSDVIRRVLVTLPCVSRCRRSLSAGLHGLVYLGGLLHCMLAMHV